MSADDLPSVLSNDGAPKPEMLGGTPAVSPFLVDHLRQAFPSDLPAEVHTAEQALAWLNLRRGQNAVINYIQALLDIQNGDAHVLPRSQGGDQSASSRSPGPRSRS